MTRCSGKLALLIALLLICALGFRWLWMGWPIKPVTWADTQAYVDMAHGLVSGLGFELDGSGYRTPGYSIFIAGIFTLFGNDNLSVSTATGYFLTEHVGGFLEHIRYTTDREQAVQAIYLKYRAQQIAKTGSHVWTIGYGLEEHGTSLPATEMGDVTGLDTGGLSNLLARMCLEAICQRPTAYYKSVKVAGARFWEPFLWRMPGFMQGTPLLLYSEGFRLGTVLFVGAVIAFASILVYRKRSPWLREHEFLMITILAIILYTAVISTVMLNADNERYRIPVQPLMTTWLVWATASWLNSGRQEANQ